MAAQKKNEAKKPTDVTPDADGWKTHDTADAGATYEKAEWVEPAPGTVLEGTLMRAFVMRDNLAQQGAGKPFRAAYVYADEKGALWTFGEKAGFARAIRGESLGVHFKLEFVEKKQQVDAATGKKTGKTIWVTRFKTRGDGVGPNVLDELVKSHRELVESGNDLPF